MAAGDPVKINLDANSFFVLTPETGVIIQGEDRAVDSKLREIFDGSKGYTSAYVFYDFVARQNFNAVVNGTTGLTVAQPGVALALANDLGIGAAKNGVATGALYTTGVNLSHQPEDMRMISGSTIQRHGIL